MSVLFQGRESDPNALEDVLLKVIDAGRACARWDSRSGAWVFDEVRAKVIADEAAAWVRANYAARQSITAPTSGWADAQIEPGATS
jgi:hypothetical protein